jgi:hypothetical protein
MILAPFLLGLLLLLPPAQADDTPASGATVPSDPIFQALLIDGTTASGRIRQLGPEGNLTLVDGAERVIPLDKLVKLTREGDPPPMPPEGPQGLVLLPDGDRLRATPGVAGETTLEAVPSSLGEAAVSIPLDSVLGVVFSLPTEPDEVEVLLARVRGEKRTADVLWLANGDRLAGGFLELTPQAVRFQPEAGPMTVERSRVAALGFNPQPVAYPRPKGLYLELTLADGSRLGATDCRVEQGHLRAKTRFGEAIRLPLSDLSRVHVRSDAITYLSERPADQAVYEAYIAPPRPYRRDESVEGHPLRLAGQPYDRGIGTQSRTLLAYRLDGRYRRFQALVGLDDRAGPLGSVAFRVRVDQQEKFASPPMAARDQPRAIDVDVTGAKFLILMTEFGERGEVRDYADWAEARLIR